MKLTKNQYQFFESHFKKKILKEATPNKRLTDAIHIRFTVTDPQGKISNHTVFDSSESVAKAEVAKWKTKGKVKVTGFKRGIGDFMTHPDVLKHYQVESVEVKPQYEEIEVVENITPLITINNPTEEEKQPIEEDLMSEKEITIKLQFLDQQSKKVVKSYNLTGTKMVAVARQVGKLFNKITSEYSAGLLEFKIIYINVAWKSSIGMNYEYRVNTSPKQIEGLNKLFETLVFDYITL